MTIRKHIVLSESDHEALLEIKKKERLPSISAAIAFLIAEKTSQENHQIVTQLMKELKPLYDVLRLRTGYTEKYMRIMLDVMNHYLITNDLDMTFGEEAKLVDIEKSLIIREAEKAYGRKISEYREKKDY